VLKHAQMVGAEIPDGAFELLRNRQADAFASPHVALLGYSAKLPGSRVLEDHYGANLLAVALAKEQVGWLSYFSDFVEELKASGIVQQTIESAGQRGMRVAPPMNRSAQR